MRWQFPDYTDRAESLGRRAMVECIDRWWAAFARQADAVDAHFTRAGDADVLALMAELETVGPAICWEFGPAVRKPGHRLCLSIEGRLRLRPLLDATLARGPRLPRWEFYAGRLPEPHREFAGSVDSRYATIPGTVATVAVGRANLIDVRYHVPPAHWPADAAAAQRFAFHTTQRLLGEDRLDRWVGRIDATRDPPGADPLLLERLASAVDRTVAGLLDNLPDRPRCQAGAGLPEGVERWTTFKLKPRPATGDPADRPGWSDLFVAVTPDADLFQASHAGGFWSGRYSRCGETFCYLKLDGRGGLDPAHFADRGAVEDALTAALSAAGLGCAMGGGTGEVYSYVELAVTDVEAAAAVIRATLRGGNVPVRSWLLFHDAELADEWLGVWAEMPPPAG